MRFFNSNTNAPKSLSRNTESMTLLYTTPVHVINALSIVMGWIQVAFFASRFRVLLTLDLRWSMVFSLTDCHKIKTIVTKFHFKVFQNWTSPNLASLLQIRRKSPFQIWLGIKCIELRMNICKFSLAFIEWQLGYDCLDTSIHKLAKNLLCHTWKNTLF